MIYDPLRTLIAGLIAGIALGVGVMWALNQPDLESTHEGYQAQIDRLEGEADDLAAIARSAREEADAYLARAMDAEHRAQEAIDAAPPLPEKPEPLPPEIIERTPPAVVSRLHYWTDIFAPKITARNAALETALEARAEEVQYWTLAHAGATEAATKWEQAHDEQRERAEVAEQRAEDYRRVTRRRIGWITTGSIILAAVIVAKQ